MFTIAAGIVLRRLNGLRIHNHHKGLQRAKM